MRTGVIEFPTSDSGTSSRTAVRLGRRDRQVEPAGDRAQDLFVGEDLPLNEGFPERKRLVDLEVSERCNVGLFDHGLDSRDQPLVKELHRLQAIPPPQTGGSRDRSSKYWPPGWARVHQQGHSAGPWRPPGLDA